MASDEFLNKGEPSRCYLALLAAFLYLCSQACAAVCCRGVYRLIQ